MIILESHFISHTSHFILHTYYFTFHITYIKLHNSLFKLRNCHNQKTQPSHAAKKYREESMMFIRELNSNKTPQAIM
jgi:hypothetical protein